MLSWRRPSPYHLHVHTMHAHTSNPLTSMCTNGRHDPFPFLRILSDPDYLIDCPIICWLLSLTRFFTCSGLIYWTSHSEWEWIYQYHCDLELELLMNLYKNRFPCLNIGTICLCKWMCCTNNLEHPCKSHAALSMECDDRWRDWFYFIYFFPFPKLFGCKVQAPSR